MNRKKKKIAHSVCVVGRSISATAAGSVCLGCSQALQVDMVLELYQELAFPHVSASLEIRVALQHPENACQAASSALTRGIVHWSPHYNSLRCLLKIINWPTETSRRASLGGDLTTGRCETGRVRASAVSLPYTVATDLIHAEQKCSPTRPPVRQTGFPCRETAPMTAKNSPLRCLPGSIP